MGRKRASYYASRIGNRSKKRRGFKGNLAVNNELQTVNNIVNTINNAPGESNIVDVNIVHNKTPSSDVPSTTTQQWGQQHLPVLQPLPPQPKKYQHPYHHHQQSQLLLKLQKENLEN